jgi:hypothetical protein
MLQRTVEEPDCGLREGINNNLQSTKELLKKGNKHKEERQVNKLEQLTWQFSSLGQYPKAN